ncbi:hypothetical protein HZC09_05155, partial [Candidatus Micrarchaeota archaeon]|nr:hypothetical protein [Candidatus Micrarchaeota archaeon]
LGNAGRWIKKQYLGHLLKKIPDDNKIVDYLATSGFEVPVVNFHANPTELTGHREGLHLSANTHNSRISNGPAVDALGGITPDLVTIHPCSLLAEYYFRPLKYASQSIYSSLHRHTKNLKLNELASRKGPQLSPKYLTDRQFTQAMLLKFNEQYSAPFNSLLRHLADNGLKSAKEVKT